MSKKLSRALFVPIMGLLPLTQGVAVTRDASHPLENSTHVENTSVRSLVISGKMLDQNTIQIRAADIPTADQVNQIRVITLMDVHGKKQRFILLSSDRTYWVRELQKYNGSIKEFNFYSIVDESGEKTNLLASKRIVAAPANQLTIVFPSRKDAQLFFTEERQKILEKAGYISTNLQAQLDQVSQADEMNQVSQIANEINEIYISAHDAHKAKVVEPIDVFPALSMIIVGVAVAVPPHPPVLAQ